jgi:CheY-like chemotaxis protein
MTTRELDNPVGLMLGEIQLLRSEGGLSTQQDSRIGVIARAARHMLDLAGGVLAFASIEAGSTSLQPSAVAVLDLIEGCLGAVAPIATELGLSLHLVASEATPNRIFADYAALRQALVNLLGNRLKYAGLGGLEVRLLAGATPRGLRIEIADISCGTDDPSREPMLMERQQAASSAGTGVGLAIAARIVGLMGGTIGQDADGDAADSPRVFWLEVPSADETQPAAREPARGRVLLVDDIAMNRDVIGGLLRAAGHEVLLAESGQEAVELAFKKMVDVVLMDVRMPDMDGLEATRRIRALPNPGSEVPILALSAYTMRNQAAQCLDAGMDGFVAKPVGYATLIRAIDDVFLRPTVLNRGLPRAE